jgi:hypothetical protein
MKKKKKTNKIQFIELMLFTGLQQQHFDNIIKQSIVLNKFPLKAKNIKLKTPTITQRAVI